MGASGLFGLRAFGRSFLRGAADRRGQLGRRGRAEQQGRQGQEPLALRGLRVRLGRVGVTPDRLAQQAKLARLALRGAQVPAARLVELG